MVRLSIRSKMLILFILLISIPLSFQGWVTYSDFSSSVERKTADYTVRILSQINHSMDQLLRDEMQKLSLLPLYSEEVATILEKYSNAGDGQTMPEIAEKTIMFRNIASTTYYRPEIRGIQIIANNGYIFTNMDPYLVKPFIEYGREPWYERVKGASGAWVMIPQHKPDYLLESTPQLYISIARLIKDPGSSQIIGVIKVDFWKEVFEQLSSKYKFGEIGNLIVLNRKNELFYEQNNEELDEHTRSLLLHTDLPNVTMNAYKQIGGQSFLTTVDYSSFSDLKMISYIPMKSLREETNGFRKFTFIIFISCLLAASLLAVLLSYKLSGPLIRLKDKMSLVERGSFRQSLPVETHDEYGQLARGFNRMSEEINRLMNEVYAIGLKEKEAEIAALLSQMNPHFMYNTLESINMKAIQHHNYEVSDMVTALGRLLHYSIDIRDRLVPLRLELDSIQSYIQIQQIRYGDRIRAIFDIDNELDELAVPKIILQPLVENAILHGIGDQERGGTIWISALAFERDLLLTVRDDGKGMSEAELSELQLALDDPNEMNHNRITNSRVGVALRNINQRIALLYGEEYGVHIDGSPGKGVSVTITIPIEKRELSYADNIAG